MPREERRKMTKSNLTETGKEMTCDECGNQCPTFETRGAVLDNLIYLAKCWKCGCSYRSEDGIHWDYIFKGKPEEAEK